MVFKKSLRTTTRKKVALSDIEVAIDPIIAHYAYYVKGAIIAILTYFLHILQVTHYKGKVQVLSSDLEPDSWPPDATCRPSRA